MPSSRESIETRLFRPIIFSRPVRLVWPPSWAGHLPFAFWLVEALRPHLLVELGTHTGLSYSAFAQAVQIVDLDTACYAVDTWQGDSHAGLYEEEIFGEWSTFHDDHFGAFSRLVRSTFDDALAQFADHSIDLLHIDGLHTYEAVRHDFESWLPKVSDRGVVLLHDIEVRERDFGAWRYWEEIRDRYPSFTFPHSHGLGVLAVGQKRTADIEWLTTLEPAGGESATVQGVFSTLGDLWTQHLELDHARGLLRRVEAVNALLQVDAPPDGAEREAAAPRLPAPTSPRRIRRLDTVREDLAAIALQYAALSARLDAVTGSEATTNSAEHDAFLARVDAAIASLAANNQERQALTDRLAVASACVATMTAECDRWAVRLDTEVNAFHEQQREREQQLIHSDLESAAFERRAVCAEAMLAAHDRRLRDGSFPTSLWRWPRRVMGSRLRMAGLTRGQLAANPRHVVPALFDPVRAARAVLETSGLFDAPYYLAQRPGAAASPLIDFIHTGADRFVSPHPLFDAVYYVRRHPALAGSGWNPLVYYLVHGGREDVDPHPLFSTRYYRAQGPDIGEANPLVHFIQHGAAEGRSPHPLFDVAFYWQRRPDVRTSGANPLRHYLERALIDDVDPHPLFDTSFYLQEAEELRRRGVNPLVHFLEIGGRERRRPNRLFDSRWYVTRYADLADVANPLMHYVEHGWREGRDPCEAFSNAGYRDRNPDVAAANIDPLRHFLEHGEAEGRPFLSVERRRAAAEPGKPAMRRSGSSALP